jgi:c-di-GMP-binding flagellar brake protein YcgR
MERVTDKSAMRENRKDKRIPEENRVAIEVSGPNPADEPRIVNALTKDISLGGARIVTDRLFEVGSSLRMTLYLSKSKQIVKARADVRWNRMVEDGLYEMGVEFEHGIPTGVLVLIQHLYGKNQSAPPIVQP